MRDLRLRPTESGTGVTEEEKAEWRKRAELFLKTELDDAEQAQHKALKNRKFYRVATSDLALGMRATVASRYRRIASAVLHG